MGIFRTNDPTQFDDVDGIIIDETAPAPSIRGVAANIALLIGIFQRGPNALTEVGSTGQFQEIFGKSSFAGNKQLANKTFGRLKIIRVIASDAVLGTLTIDDGVSTDIIKFDALDKGVYGNLIKITTAAGSVQGTKYTVTDTNVDNVIAPEIYDNLLITQSDFLAKFANSQLVDVTILDNSAEPDVIGATALASGSDGTVADTDYESALALAAVELSANFVFFDVNNTTRNGYLKVHVAATQDKMTIVCGSETDDKAAVITDVVNNRDTDGRIIYAFPYLQTVIKGVKEFTNPCAWYASILSNTSPHLDPAFAENTQFLAGVTAMKFPSLTRTDYIALMEAGVSSFELDPDIGFKIKSGVVTQILSSSKIMVFRRRMADFLSNSIAKFLKAYQNGVNALEKRDEVKAQIEDFVRRATLSKILPSDAEVKGGKASLVDTDSLNTDSSVALGFFKIKYRQRIFSSMRFIVLQAEIGESVVVTEE